MKLNIAIVVLLMIGAAQGEWRNTLRPAGAAGSKLTVVAEGQAKYDIAIPAAATSVERKAAEDLQHWIAEITGATLKIGSDESGHAIAIATRADFSADEYEIAIDERQNLRLTGSAGRGVINAVYALLEEDIGCRFYTNESVVLPHDKSLVISPVLRRYAPKLWLLRDPFYFASFDPVWSLRNRTTAPDAKVPEEFGGHVDYAGLFVHTAAQLLPPDKYFKEHPEYFAKDAKGNPYSAQVCPSSPEVARVMTENVLAILAKHPETEVVSVSKNDSGGDQVCHCAECEKRRAAEGTEMANQLVLVNAVADEVAKTHPKVMIDTLAYLDTIGVPKTIRPVKNVIVRFCNDSGAWNNPFTPARKLGIAEVAKKWASVHDKISVWDYNINFSHFLAPMPNMDVISDNLRFWTENHAIGVMTQGGYQSTAERDEMRSWVIAKLMWDPSRDVDALVEDFTLGHYGTAGAVMMEYESLLKSAEKKHEKELSAPPGGIRFPMTLGLYDKDFLDAATDIFSRAEKVAGDDVTLMHRVERAELPVMYVKLMQGVVTKESADRFETIARREKVDWLAEGQTRLDAQMTTWRKSIR